MAKGYMCCILALSFLCMTTFPTANCDPAAFLAAHNTVRSVENQPPLAWNTTLEGYASAYAQLRAADCVLVHSEAATTYGLGENLFWGSDFASFTDEDAVESWASEKLYYDYDTNSCEAGRTCEHYTQVVWGATEAVGCAVAECDAQMGVFAVCNYSPAGNVLGERPY